MAEACDDLQCDPCILLRPAIDIAIQAGRRILEVYEAGFSVEHKEDMTPLTEADMAAHEVIDAGLVYLTPAIPVLTEESTNIPFSERSRWQRYWLVDPLDGTREFIDRTGEFTVNIALIDNHQPVLGVVYAPVLGVYYYACRGQGAFKREACNEPQRIQVRKHRGEKVVVAGGRMAHQRGGSLERFLENIGDYEAIAMGSALKSCLVAEGRADIYARLGPTSEWDTAAAQCVVEEAGGQVTDTRMQPLRYNTKDELLNPHFFVFGDSTVPWSSYL
ncbi:MAG TPA: 3'(2'),5'-bisphosphate nucleotidase CysQ [Gammaproteobacteria bacterium]